MDGCNDTRASLRRAVRIGDCTPCDIAIAADSMSRMSASIAFSVAVTSWLWPTQSAARRVLAFICRSSSEGRMTIRTTANASTRQAPAVPSIVFGDGLHSGCVRRRNGCGHRGRALSPIFPGSR